jgi:putative endonuclease
MSRQHAEQRGRRAEWLAALFLNLKGYQILARRLKTPLGEIDLLARRGATLAIIEVKQRGDYQQAAYAITPRQQERLKNAARFVLAQRPELSNHSIRFDALLVNRWGWPQHWPNAFSDASS